MIVEIEKLANMLKCAGIPFERDDDPRNMPPYYRMRRIKYPSRADEICSVIEGLGSHGNQANLLEIRGLLKPCEGKDVAGWLTAENVFARIEEHYHGTQL